MGPGRYSSIRTSISVAKGIVISKQTKLFGYKDTLMQDFNLENIANEKLAVSDFESNEEILKSVLDGSGKKSHKEVVALNAALVLWAAGSEDDLKEGFNKALFSINQGDPWKKFLLLKNYLNAN